LCRREEIGLIIAALQMATTVNRQDSRRRSLKRMNEATTEPWQVGVLFSQTGHMSVIFSVSRQRSL